MTMRQPPMISAPLERFPSVSIALILGRLLKQALTPNPLKE